MSKLEGKVAAITGGNSGIGLAIAKRFRAEGAAVAIMGRNSETLESAVAEIGEGTVSSMGDVQSLSDLDEFFGKISEHFGSLDIVVANAGAFTWRDGDVDEEVIVDVVDVDVVDVVGAPFSSPP